MGDPLKCYAVYDSTGEIQAWHWDPIMAMVLGAEVAKKERILLLLRYKQAIDTIICLKNRLPEN